MKKIDKLVLDSFLGPFIITFLVVVFILLNIQMLRYFDDIIGKGLGWNVIGELLFYFAIFTTPTALPLAVLLSSLIAFGNLGEHFELTAIKSAGISLIRTLRPIFVFVLFLTVAAFYANNNLVPKAALQAYSLLYDIKQKKPALDLREGSFYNGISDISIKVNKKYEDGITLGGIVVYDHRKNDGNKEVTVADSGRMFTILNERYLKFELFRGYNYTEGASSDRQITGQDGKNNETLSRSKFSKTQVVYDLSSFDLKKTDTKWFQGNRIMRNLSQLDQDIDSINQQILSQRLGAYNTRASYFNFYLKDSVILPPDLRQYKLKQDSIQRIPYVSKGSQANISTDPNPTKNVQAQPTINATIKTRPIVKNNERTVNKKEPVKRVKGAKSLAKSPPRIKNVEKPKPIKPKAKIILTDSALNAKIDSILISQPNKEILASAATTVRQVKSQVLNTNSSIEGYIIEVRTFKIQWHKILASSFACIAMFLIGAPLGAIIKRGGLGVPFLVSIVFFIIYYILSMQGEKIAKQGGIPIATGIWAADFILLIFGLLFLRQARADARLFEADFYRVVFDKLKTWFASRKQAKTAVN
ncbi:MAG: LptF/LptG family permease [Chryseolinea sp.]